MKTKDFGSIRITSAANGVIVSNEQDMMSATAGVRPNVFTTIPGLFEWLAKTMADDSEKDEQ